MILLSRMSLEDSEMGRNSVGSVGRSSVVDETMWLPIGCSDCDCDVITDGGNTVAEIWYSLGSKLAIIASTSDCVGCVGLVLVNTVDMDGSLVVGMVGSLVMGW